jgi:hypothetical protein
VIERAGSTERLACKNGIQKTSTDIATIKIVTAKARHERAVVKTVDQTHERANVMAFFCDEGHAALEGQGRSEVERECVREVNR